MREFVYYGYKVTGTANCAAKEQTWHPHARVSWAAERQAIHLDDPECFNNQNQAEEYALEMGKNWVKRRLGGAM